MVSLMGVGDYLMDSFGFKRWVNVFDLYFVQVLVVQLIVANLKTEIRGKSNLYAIDRTFPIELWLFSELINTYYLASDISDKL